MDRTERSFQKNGRTERSFQKNRYPTLVSGYWTNPMKVIYIVGHTSVKSVKSLKSVIFFGDNYWFVTFHDTINPNPRGIPANLIRVAYWPL